MIYLPIELTGNNCVYIYDSNTIRVYDRQPVSNSTIGYRDFFLGSHYLMRSGSTQFTSYNAPNITCMNHDQFTTNVWYRHDIDSICITFATIFFVFILFVSFLLKTFRRGLFR